MVSNCAAPFGGKRAPHVSHQLHSFKGVFFCNRCGNIGAKQLRKLVDKCDGVANYYGKHHLELIWSKSVLPSTIKVPEQSFRNLVGGCPRAQSLAIVVDPIGSLQPVASADNGSNIDILPGTVSETMTIVHSFDDPNQDIMFASDSD